MRPQEKKPSKPVGPKPHSPQTPEHRQRCHHDFFVTVNVNSHNDGSHQSQEQHVGAEEQKGNCFKTAMKTIARAFK